MCNRLDGLLLALLLGLATTNASGAARSDETDLATGARASLDRRRVTDVLVVTTSVGMLNRVHGDTTHHRPAVPLGLVLVVGASGLQHRLVRTATAGDDACKQRCKRVKTDVNAAFTNVTCYEYVLPFCLPIIARFADGITFLAPDGRRTRDLPVSGLWATTMA